MLVPKATTRHVINFILSSFREYSIFQLNPISPGMEASLNLRSHFLSRSAQLITPLARYLNTLIPSPTEVKNARKASEFPSSTPPSTAQKYLGLRLKPFNPTNFFASLKTHGSILPFKSTRKKTEFYERCVFFFFHLVKGVFADLCCSDGSSPLLSGHG